jgi:hypothetical protein
MQTLKLVPMTQEQKELLHIDRRPESGPLSEEVGILRGAFRLVWDCLKDHAYAQPGAGPGSETEAESESGAKTANDAGKVAFYAVTLTRLSDSIVRAILASRRLARSHNEMAEVQAELKRLFREIGWGEQS